MDAYPLGLVNDLAGLVGLSFLAHYENQGTGPAVLLVDVQHPEVAGDPVAGKARAQELPIAAAVQPITVKRKRYLEM